MRSDPPAWLAGLIQNRRGVVTAALFFSWTGFTLVGQGRRRLIDEEVSLLLLNVPIVLQVEAKGGCPTIEMIPYTKDVAEAQIRNGCPTSGMGMIDNFYVDRLTGRIWIEIDQRQYIDSPRLQRLRRYLFNRR